MYWVLKEWKTTNHPFNHTCLNSYPSHINLLNNAFQIPRHLHICNLDQQFRKQRNTRIIYIIAKSENGREKCHCMWLRLMIFSSSSYIGKVTMLMHGKIQITITCDDVFVIPVKMPVWVSQGEKNKTKNPPKKQTCLKISLSILLHLIKALVLSIALQCHWSTYSTWIF